MYNEYIPVQMTRDEILEFILNNPKILVRKKPSNLWYLPHMFLYEEDILSQYEYCWIGEKRPMKFIKYIEPKRKLII